MKTITLTVVAAVALGVVTIVGGSLLIYGVGQYNTAVELKTQYEAKVAANKAQFDNTFKVIKQTAQVSQAQLDKLKDIYTSYADARSNEGAGQVMNWIQEAVPNVDTSTMNNLQNIIVSSRNGWTARQEELVDISREYNQLLVRFPANLVLGMMGFQKINPQIVTSEKTEEAFSTGQDNDTSVF